MYNMGLEEAKVHKKELNATVDKYSAVLQSFETSNMGLVPDHIRETSEWKEAKTNYDRSFTELRNFNKWFVKEFRKKGKKAGQ